MSQLLITTTEQDGGVFFAWLTDNPTYRASGATEEQAIGKLIIDLSLDNDPRIHLVSDPTGIVPE